MAAQTSGRTGLVIDVAFGDANEILFEGIPAFSDTAVGVFILNGVHTVQLQCERLTLKK